MSKMRDLLKDCVLMFGAWYIPCSEFFLISFSRWILRVFRVLAEPFNLFSSILATGFEERQGAVSDFNAPFIPDVMQHDCVINAHCLTAEFNNDQAA